MATDTWPRSGACSGLYGAAGTSNGTLSGAEAEAVDAIPWYSRSPAFKKAGRRRSRVPTGSSWNTRYDATPIATYSVGL